MNALFNALRAFFAGADGLVPELFCAVLSMSLSASAVILCVFAARLVLRRAPKVFSYMLWAVVLFRLLCPVTFESKVAIVPDAGALITNAAAEADSGDDGSNAYVTEPGGDPTAHHYGAADSGNAAGPVYHTVTVTGRNADDNGDMIVQRPVERWSAAEIVSFIWLAVGAAIALFSIISLLRLHLCLREAIRLNHNIYLCDRISTPFVMGLAKPRIYLPAGLGTQERSYIVLHEQHHIKRFDHIVKPVAFAALCIHWFNPLVWLAFALAMRDMEMSCDEAVLRVVNADIRTDYSMSLLALASGKRMFAPTPLAFGESDTSVRIKNIVRYKKPAAIVVALAVAAVIASCGVLGGSRAVDHPQSGGVTVEGAVEGAYDSGGNDLPLTVGDPSDTAPDDDPSPSGGALAVDDASQPEEEPPTMTDEELEAEARAQIIASIPGLTLSEVSDLPYTTDNTQAFDQEDIHSITEAYLLTDYGLLTLSDADALESLSQTYLSAEKMRGEPGCGFYTPLFLKRADGTVGYVYPASDGCGAFKAGDSFYEYDEDFFNFYSLFGMGYVEVEETDEQGRVIKRQTFYRLWQQSIEEYEYDGQLLVRRYCANTSFIETRTYEHDEYGRLVKAVKTRRNYGEDKIDEDTYIYAYDERGNCVSIIPENGQYSFLFKYDEYDRCIERNYYGITEVYDYDEHGNCTKVSEYNSRGELLRWHEYRYDDQSRVVGWCSYNGDGSQMGDYRYEQAYEEDGRTYRKTIDSRGNVAEISYMSPPQPVNGPFFYE